VIESLAAICSAASSEVRADVIRQFHERGNEHMAELLIEFEENEAARQAVIKELRGSL
jgi:hypothetical protein